jgi:signal transduction histidine kinase
LEATLGLGNVRIDTYRIETDEQGFASLARVHAAIEKEPFGEVFVDCSRLQWIDANMCAPLAAAIIAPERRILLQKLHPLIETVLRKNGFLGGALEDTHGTTIHYQQFDLSGRTDFVGYVERNFRGKGLPMMSAGLQREFRRSIFELFENAVAHSNTQLGIFACGQFFPRKHRLHFCLADRGIGIPNSVRSYLGRAFRASEAIDWAMSGQNTTRRIEDGVPGGLGLKIMRDFIAQNGGAIRVASETGYWSARGADVSKATLPAAFPGTVVDIEINAADSKMYQLADEVDPTAIF